MANESSLGRLHRVPLREVWEREAEGFTPWLAREDNLELLSETVGIDLELEGQERSVGPFRADILCKDLATGSWVLIENQLERTDHTHLGQLLTYAAGLQAVTILWVAQRFTEEHRATLDWLNEITDERFNFFGLEVELWRIGESAIAPKFNIVCKPNDWSRSIAESASRIEATEPSDTKQLQLAYWRALWDVLEKRSSFLRGTKARPQHWNNFAIGRSYFGMTAYVSSRKPTVSVNVWMNGAQSKQFYAALLPQRDQLDAQFGPGLIWEELPEKRESRVVARLEPARFEDQDDWPRQHQWICDTMERMHRLFAPRIKALDIGDGT